MSHVHHPRPPPRALLCPRTTCVKILILFLKLSIFQVLHLSNMIRDTRLDVLIFCFRFNISHMKNNTLLFNFQNCSFVSPRKFTLHSTGETQNTFWKTLVLKRTQVPRHFPSPLFLSDWFPAQGIFYPEPHFCFWFTAPLFQIKEEARDPH